MKDMFKNGPFLWSSKHPDPSPSSGPTRRRVESKSTPESRKGTYIGDDPRFAAYWRRDKSRSIDWRKASGEVWKATKVISGEALKQAPVVLPVARALSGGDSGALGGGSGTTSGGGSGALGGDSGALSGGDSGGHLKVAKVLVLEDMREVLTAMQDMFESYGDVIAGHGFRFEMTYVRYGHDALKLNPMDFDVAVLDLEVVSPVSGAGVNKFLKEGNPKIKTILHSGSGAVLEFKDQFNEFISKGTFPREAKKKYPTYNEYIIGTVCELLN